MDSEEIVFRGIIALPEEYLEKILTDPPRRNVNSLLDGLVSAPKIIMSLFQSMPMPWESDKTVSCVYNTDGLVLDCKSIHTEDSVNYICKWLYQIEGIRNNIEYSIKRSNYTAGEYKILRKKYPAISVSERKGKEEIFPAIYHRKKETGRSMEKHANISGTDHTITRRKAPRSTVSVIGKIQSRHSMRKKGRKATEEVEQKDKIEQKERREYKCPKKEYKSTMGWIKFAKIYLEVGRRLLLYVIREKKIGYIDISEKYEISRKRELKTKEKKRSRLGQTFHIVKELLKLLSRIVEIVEKKSQKRISTEESMACLFKEFSTVGISTGIYRYKYSTVRQIGQTSKISKVLKYLTRKTEKRYNLLWCELWRVWVLFMQGVSPLLSERLEKYVVRRREGREKRKKKETKQRERSNEDIRFKESTLEEIGSIVKIEPSQKQAIVNILKTGWKQWKKGEEYASEIEQRVERTKFKPITTEGTAEVQNILVRKIEEKGIEWGISTVHMWNKYVSCKIKNKKETKKIRSRILRASMIINKRIQKISLEQEIAEIDNNNICIDDTNSRASILSISTYDESVLRDILKLSIERVESTYQRHLKEADRKDLEYIEKCKGSIENTLKSITKRIRKKKVALSISIDYSAQDITYHYPVEERLVDSFLEYLISYHIDKNRNSEILPVDTEPLPCTLMAYSEEIRNILLKRTEEGRYEPIYYTSIDYTVVPDEIDRKVLIRYLKRLFDQAIYEWIIERLEVVLEYKGIETVQRVGISRGLEFYPSIAEIVFREIDKNIKKDAKKDLLKYFRCGSIVYMVHTEENPMKGIDKIRTEDHLYNTYVIDRLTADPFYCVMCLIDKTSKIFANIPAHFLDISKNTGINKPVDPLVYAYSYGMSKITSPTVCRKRIDLFPSMIHMKDFDITIAEKRSYLKTSEHALRSFEISIRNILYDSTGSSFSIIVDRWNRLLMQTVLLFRETLTQEMQHKIEVSEEKLKRRIMAAVNTQMRKKFPNILFYAPKEVGGLGLLSSAVLSESTIPWADEIAQSKEAYDKILEFLNEPGINTYHMKDPLKSAIKYTYSKDISIHTTGIPRINAFIHKPREYLMESGWRRRNYTISSNRRWTNRTHDGNWMDWKRYNLFLSRTNGCTLDPAVRPIAKIEQNSPNKSLSSYVSEGTLYRAVRQEWNRMGTVEEIEYESADKNSSMLICNTTGQKGRTRAQISDASRLPNRMFMLWWSPVINRHRVNIGHPEAVDGTGVVLRGKTPSLRISYRNIFSDGLWMKIYREIVENIAGSLERATITHGVESVCVKDSTLSDTIENTLSPSILVNIKDIKNISIYSIWITVHIRWGDIDSVPVEDECMEYFEGMHTSCGSLYGKHQCFVLVDLRSCEYSVKAASNSLCEIVEIVEEGLDKNMPGLVSLNILRERIARAVGYSDRRSEDVYDPKDIFVKDRSVIIQIGDKACAGIHIQSGKYFKFEYKSGSKISNIIKVLYDILLDMDVQYIYAPEREYSLLSKAGISYVLIRTRIHINLVDIPKSFGNLYGHWPDTKPYTALARLALVLRYCEICRIDLSSIIDIQAPEEEWILLEKRLICVMLQAITRDNGVSNGLGICPSTMHQCVQDIIFGLKGKSPFIAGLSGNSWTRMTNWRDRYRVVDSTEYATITDQDTHLDRSYQKDTILHKSSLSVEIDRDIVDTLASISDMLVPVVGFICGDSLSHFITPRQLFSSKNFFISSFDTEKYPISVIVQSMTPFSQSMSFTYTGIQVASSLCVISVDITTGLCTGSLCTAEYIGNTLSLFPKEEVTINCTNIKTKKTTFLTATGWNRNICEPIDPSSILVPERPLPFYSEEFRKSHFHH